MAEDKDKYLFNRQTAYDLLKEEGYTDIGESAEELFKDRGNSELAYKLLRKAGYTDLGKNYDEFASMLYGPGEDEPTPALADEDVNLNFDDEPNLDAITNKKARERAEKEQRKAKKGAPEAPKPADKSKMTPQERTRAFNEQFRNRQQEFARRNPEAWETEKALIHENDELAKQDLRKQAQAKKDVERYAPGRKDDRSLYYEPSDELILDNAANASGYSVDEAIRLGKEYGSIVDENEALREQIAAFNEKWGQGGMVDPSRADQYKAEYEALDGLSKQNEERYKAMMSSTAGREFTLLQGKVEELKALPDSPEKAWEMTRLIAQISRNPIARASMGDDAPSGSQIDFDLMKGEIDYMQGRIANGSADKAQKKEYKARMKELRSQILDNDYYQQDVAKRIEDTGAELEDVYSRMLAIRERTMKDKPLGETLDDALLAEPEYQNLRLAASQLEQSRRKLSHIRDKNSGDFWVNFADVFADPNTYNFGLVNLETTLAAKSAFDDMDKAGAETLLSAVVGKQEAESENGEFVGAKGRWGQIAAGSIPFIANIALTGGFSGVAGAVEKGLSRVAGEKAAEKYLVKATGKVAGDLAAGLVSANTIGGATTANDILNNYFGQLVLDENGNYGYRDGTNLFHAIRKGEISNMLEYSTERFGDHVQRLIGLSIARGAKNGAINLGRETFARSFGVTTDDLRKLGLRSMDKGGAKWIDHAMDFLARAGERAGVQGYPFEVMEEEVNIIGNAILYGGDKWMDFSGITDKEQQADIWGGMLYSIGVMQGTSIGIYGAASGLVGLSNMKAYKKMESQLTAVSAAAERALGDRWAPIKADLEDASNEEIPSLVAGIAKSTELTDADKEMALSYIKGLYLLRGFNSGTLNAAKRRITGKDADDALQSLADADTQVADAYMLGYMSDPDNADELQKAFTRQQESLQGAVGQSDMTDEDASAFLADPGATDEQKDAVVSYLMARAATQGLVDARDNERIALKSTLQMILEHAYGGKFFYQNPNGEIVVEKTFIKGADGKWVPSFILSGEPNASGEVAYRMQDGTTGFITRDKVGTIDEQGNFNPGETVVTPLDRYMDEEADSVEAEIAAQKSIEDAEKERARKEEEDRKADADAGKKARIDAETRNGLKEAVRKAVSDNGGRIIIDGEEGTLTHETEEGATFSPDDDSLENRPMSWREIADAVNLSQEESDSEGQPGSSIPEPETQTEDENGIPRDPDTGKLQYDAPGVSAEQTYDAIYGSERFSEKNADKFVFARYDAAKKALDNARKLVEEGEREKAVIDDWDLKDGEDLEDLEERQQIAKAKVDEKIASASEELPELERKAAHWGTLRNIAERNTRRRAKEEKQEARRKRLIEKYGVDTSRFDLSPQTLEEAVAAYLGGDSTGLINLDDAIRETVGRTKDGRVPLDIFRHIGRYGILTKNGGRSIQDVAADIVREFYGDLEHDEQHDEARNAIIDFLLGNTKKEMREYIFNNRLEAAEKELTLLNDENEVLRSAGVDTPAGNQDGTGAADGGGLRAEPGADAVDGGTGTDGGRVLPGLARREQGVGGNEEELEVATDERPGTDRHSDGQPQQEVFDRHPGEPARGTNRSDSGSDEGGELGAEGADGGKRNGVTDGLSGPVQSGAVHRGVHSHRVGLKGRLSYIRHSKGKSLDTVSPSAIAEANDKTLSEIETQYGSVDGFVMGELGYDSKDALYAALSAEQIDGVAMAIHQMKNGKAMIIGDQTGVGKGRQMAALIRWAYRQGKKPIFFTKEDSLFSDLYRDMKDTGSQSLRPLIINAKAKMINGDTEAYSAPSETEMDKIIQDGMVPDGYDYVVLTYSQLSSGDAISRAEKKSKTEGRERSMARADFIRKIAKDNYLLCDESHAAAGQGQTGVFMRSIIPSTLGVAFASATFAKRPDSMPLYDIKSAMVEAKVGALELIQMVQRGGVTLQEILSRNLAEAGQMVRRQRLMDDVETEWKTVTNPELAGKAKEGYDGVIGLYKDIIDFRRSHGGAFSAPNTYSFVRQLLLSLKVDAIVEEAVSELKLGRKPLIAMENTRQSAIGDFMAGDELPDATFGLTLAKMLGGTNGLDEEAQHNHQELLDRIHAITKDIPASPIDAITEKLEALGYKVAEITGRTKKVVTRDGKTVVEKRAIDPVESANSFNNGGADVLILNRSGATGISLHASETFGDQRQRTMIIAQPLGDINEYQQMLGRIDRTGQVARGRYINLSLPIPAEQRFNMMLANKLRSLSANTTTESGTGNIETPDLLNRYGAKVMCEYLQDNPDMFDALGIQLGYKAHPVRSIEDLDKYTPVEEDAEKITAALALLPIEQQEAFYEDVTRRYEDLIKSLDEAGQNELKSTILPLRAKTLSKKVGTQGKDPDGSNPFAKDSYIERAEVDVLTKPMTVSEIEDARESLGGKDAIGKLRDRLEAQRNARLEAEERRYGDARKENEGKDLQDIEARHTSNVERINRIHDTIAAALAKFGFDRTYLIHEEFGMDAEDNTNRNRKVGAVPGVLVGFKAPKEGESLTPSKTTAVFATLDGRRKVEVKLSDGFILDDILALTDANAEDAKRTTLENWDSSIPKETREERHILTGNVLQAWADVSNGGVLPGRLAYFTDEDGNVRYGILMNKSWKPERTRSAGAPISDFLQEILDGKVIRSTDGKVVIEKGREKYNKGKFTVTVPKPAKESGGISTDKEVSRLSYSFSIHDYNFKRATVTAKKLPELLQYLSEKYNVRVGEDGVTDYVEQKPAPAIVNPTTTAYADKEADYQKRLDNVRARMAETANDYGRDSGEYRSLQAEEKKVISDYIDSLDPEHIIIDVISVEDAAEFYRKAGYGKEEIDDFLAFLKNNPVAAQYIPKTGGIVFFTENQFTAEVTTRAYYHERQHNLTLKDGLHKLLAQTMGNDVELLEAELSKLTDAETAAAYRAYYKGNAAEGLANEIISYAAEKVYTSPEFVKVLDNLQLADETKKILNVVVNGQSDSQVRPAIRGRSDGRVADTRGNEGSEQASEGEPGKVQGEEGDAGSAESDSQPAPEVIDIHSTFGLPKAVEHIYNLSLLLGVPFKMDEGIKEKGKFSPKDGSISINFSAHQDIEDLERTYLHEAVAHYGLRKLFGNDWKSVRVKLYEQASPEIKAKVDAIAKADGLSTEVAMEEYIAQFAEDGRFTEEEDSFWRKVVEAIRELLSGLGIRGNTLTDADFRALLYASYRNLQNVGAIEKASQLVTYQRLRMLADAERNGNEPGPDNDGPGPGPSDFSTVNESHPGELTRVQEEYREDLSGLQTDEEVEDLFRRNRDYVVAETAADVYSRRAASPWQNIRAQLVDEYQPVLNLVRSILNSKGDVESKDVSSLTDDERVIERLVEKSSREMYEIERYGTEFMRPMQDAIGRFIKTVNKSTGKDGRIRIKDLVRYACLKHGLERNGVFARRDAKIEAKKVYDDAYSKRKEELDTRERTEKARLKVKLDEGIISDVTYHNETTRLEAELQHLRDQAKMDHEANIANVDNETAREYKRILGKNRQTDYSALMSWFEKPSSLKRSDFPSKEKYNEAKVMERTEYVDGVTDLASAEAMALSYVEGMERKAGTEVVDELWKQINAATKETLRMQNEHGVLSAKQYADLSGMFKYYLPMRGFEDPTAEMTYVYYNNPRGDGFAPTVVAAKGRHGTKFKDPFGMIGFMHASAVSQGLKNEAKLSLLTLVRNHPTELVTVSRTWYKKTVDVDDTGKPIYEPVYPDIPEGTATKDREAIVAQFENDMKDLQRQGEAYNSQSGVVRNGGIVAFEKQGHKSEHVVRVLEGGREYDIIINGNPAAAQAINGLPGRSKAVEGTAMALDAVRNFMSRAATTWNPGFWVVNFFRDSIQGINNAFIRDGAGYLAKYGANWARIVLQIGFHSAGAEKLMEKMDPRIAAYYKEFNENGGPMRWARILNEEEYTRKIDRYIRHKQYEKVNALNFGRFLGRIVSSIGESIETLTRFTTFVTSREAGKPLHEAISDAKEITTNFSRKGRRSYSYDDITTWQYENGRDLTTPEKVAFLAISKIAGLLRHFVLFYNPGWQGLEQIRSNFAKHPYRSSLVAATYALTGFLMMFLRAAGSDGDDDEDRKDEYGHVSDYHRRKFFLIPNGEGSFIRIPLPQEYRWAYALGDIAASATLKDRPWDMLVHDAFTEIADLGPAGVFADEVGVLHGVLGWLAPPYEVHENKNFMGGRIYDNGFADSKDLNPNWTKALPTTGEGYVKMAEWLNKVSGGHENNDVVKGVIDWNPAVIEHLVNGYLSGVSREAELTTRYVRAKERGESIRNQDVPIVGRVKYDVGDRDAYYTTLYYHFKGLADKADVLDKKFRDRSGNGSKQVQDFYDSKDYKYLLVFKEQAAEERDLQAEKKDAEKQNDSARLKDAQLKIQHLHEQTGKRCLELYFQK